VTEHDRDHTKQTEDLESTGQNTPCPVPESNTDAHLSHLEAGDVNQINDAHRLEGVIGDPGEDVRLGAPVNLNQPDDIRPSPRGRQRDPYRKVGGQLGNLNAKIHGAHKILAMVRSGEEIPHATRLEAAQSVDAYMQAAAEFLGYPMPDMVPIFEFVLIQRCAFLQWALTRIQQHAIDESDPVRHAAVIAVYSRLLRDLPTYLRRTRAPRSLEDTPAEVLRSEYQSLPEHPKETPEARKEGDAHDMTDEHS